LTFGRHPFSVLAPERSPRLLMTLEERVEAIKAAGPSEVAVLDFDSELAKMPPGRFVDSVILSRFGPVHVYCGDNWRFGADGKGDVALLRSMGLEATVVPYAEYKGKPISSTRIRSALEAGEIEDANAMLDGAFTVSGTVFKGKGKGAQLGFPTVNVQLCPLGIQLPLGVYEAVAAGKHAVANYGFAPTMGDSCWSSPVLELHFLDAPSDFSLSGRLEVSIIKFLRPERWFSSAEELKTQLALDVAQAASDFNR
jgi:riboflavin kinase/FMN adenylyltransferase